MLEKFETWKIDREIFEKKKQILHFFQNQKQDWESYKSLENLYVRPTICKVIVSSSNFEQQNWKNKYYPNLRGPEKFNIKNRFIKICIFLIKIQKFNYSKNHKLPHYITVFAYVILCYILYVIVYAKPSYITEVNRNPEFWNIRKRIRVFQLQFKRIRIRVF